MRGKAKLERVVPKRTVAAERTPTAYSVVERVIKLVRVCVLTLLEEPEKEVRGERQEGGEREREREMDGGRSNEMKKFEMIKRFG